MTKRREVTFEADSLIIDRPNRAEVEVLCGRAARLSYLTQYELEQLMREIRFVRESGPVFSREAIPVNLSPSVRSVNLYNIITPLLQIIHVGPIIILDNQHSGCQVYIFRVFDEIWISFRGTQLKDIASLRKDMGTDLNFRQRVSSYLPDDNKVHRGFDDSYMSVRDEIRHEIETVFAFEGEKPLKIIGHSLGGALATLAALDLCTNLPLTKPVSVRTYGSPCVGNAAFVQNFNANVKDSKRYAIYMDPVPLLLSEIAALGPYVHVAEFVAMNETRRKHNVEHYIKILCRYAHVDDDIEEEVDEIVDIEEEEIFYTSSDKQSIGLLIAGASLLILAIILYKR